MQRNLFAYTSPNDHPEYLSINERDGRIFVSVRGPRKERDGDFPYERPGDVVEIELPPEQIGGLTTALEIERADRKVRRDIFQNPAADNRGLREKLVK